MIFSSPWRKADPFENLSGFLLVLDSIVCQINLLALNILDIKVLITDFHAKVSRSETFA